MFGPDAKLAERFWSKVVRSETCWLWAAHLNREGYGKFGFKKRSCKLAHRVAYELERGPIPRGAHVLHTCDVRACVRPDHLFLGDQAANNADMLAKGRHRVPRGEEQWKARLTRPEVLWILEGIHSGLSSQDLSLKFGVSRSTIEHIRYGRSWKHVSKEFQDANPQRQ